MLRDNNRNEPYPNLDLKINMFSMAGASLSGETKTDSAGAFAFVSNVDYMGDWITQISTKNEKGRYKWSRVVLNRFFDIAPRAFGYGELNLSAPKEVSQSPLFPAVMPARHPVHFSGRIPSLGPSLLFWLKPKWWGRGNMADSRATATLIRAAKRPV